MECGLGRPSRRVVSETTVICRGGLVGLVSRYLMPRRTGYAFRRILSAENYGRPSLYTISPAISSGASLTASSRLRRGSATRANRRLSIAVCAALITAL